MSYTPDTFSAGEAPTTAKWNELFANDASFNDGTGIANLEIGSGHTSLKNDYKFSVYRNAALNSSTTSFALPCDTKVYDTGSNVDVTTNKGRFTAPIAGFYNFSGATTTFIGNNLAAQVFLYLNGAANAYGSYAFNGTGGAANITANVNQTIQLSANDYVELYTVASSGTPAMQGGATTCYFSGFLLSQT